MKIFIWFRVEIWFGIMRWMKVGGIGGGSLDDIIFS
jgi:hypothetical protein